jgi:hypothetical protein
MIATNQTQIEGKTYDRYSLNLAITGKYKANGSTDAQVAMRLIPTRIENGQVETVDAAAIGISLGTLAGSDAPTQQAVAAIQAALQTYLTAKGL